MQSSHMTKILACLAISASAGPIVFAAQLGISPDMDISPYFPIWAGYSALFAIALFGLTFISVGFDMATGSRA